MPTLTFHPHRQQPPRTGAQALDGLLLQPGSNTLSEAEMAKLRAHPAWAGLVELGAVEIEGGIGRQDVAPAAELETEPEGPAMPAIPEKVARRLNLNTATEAELVALPKIGPATAAKLLAGRPFNSLGAAQEASGLRAPAWAIVAPLVYLEEV